MSRSLSTIDAAGQVGLGERYAGRDVLIEEVEEGVWVVKVAEMIPDSERWLYEIPVAESLTRSLSWVRENPARESDLDELEKRILGGAAAGS